MDVLIRAAELFINFLLIAIVVRAIMSFLLPVLGANPSPILVSLNAIVNQVTEPILGPLRRVLPTFGVLDFSPMAAIIILIVIKEFILGRV